MKKWSVVTLYFFAFAFLLITFQNCSKGFSSIKSFAIANSSTAPDPSDSVARYVTTTTPILSGTAGTGSIASGTHCATQSSCMYGWSAEGQTVAVSCQSGFINVTASGYGGGSAYTSCLNYAASTCTGTQTCAITFNGTNCENEPNPNGSNAGFLNVTCADKVQIAAIRYADFKNSIGVQIHLGANIQGNAYTNYQNVANNLNYLNIKFVRDGLYPKNSTDTALKSAYQLILGMGVQFIAGATSTNPDPVSFVADLDDMLALYPNSVTAVEGPNEIANFPFTYKGQSGQVAADAYQKDLYQTVHADPHTNGVAVLNYTTGILYSLGAPATNQSYGSGISDFVNIHPYANNGFGGYQPGWYISNTNLLEYGANRLSPEIITEAGFNTATAADGVTFDAQAILTLNTIFDSAINEISRVYIYELLDMYNDTSNANRENHWGLFDGNNQPKPAAVSIHNLMNAFADAGPNSKTFSLKPIEYSISNLPERAGSLLLQSSSGQYAIVIWNESDRLQTGSTTVPASTAITLKLSNSFSTVSVYDLIAGTSAPANLTNKQLSLTLSTKPVVVFLNN